MKLTRPSEQIISYCKRRTREGLGTRLYLHTYLCSYSNHFMINTATESFYHIFQSLQVLLKVATSFSLLCSQAVEQWGVCVALWGGCGWVGVQGSARHREDLTATATHAGSTLGALREMTDCLYQQGVDCRAGESQVYLIPGTDQSHYSILLHHSLNNHNCTVSKICIHIHNIYI